MTILCILISHRPTPVPSNWATGQAQTDTELAKKSVKICVICGFSHRPTQTDTDVFLCRHNKGKGVGPSGGYKTNRFISYFPVTVHHWKNMLQDWPDSITAWSLPQGVPGYLHCCQMVIEDRRRIQYNILIIRQILPISIFVYGQLYMYRQMCTL